MNMYQHVNGEVYKSMCTYTYVYIYINMHVYLHLYVCVYVYIYIYIHTQVCTYVCMYVYLSIYIYTYISLSLSPIPERSSGQGRVGRLPNRPVKDDQVPLQSIGAYIGLVWKGSPLLAV